MAFSISYKQAANGICYRLKACLLVFSSSVAESHHDLYRIDSALEDLFETPSCANIPVDGLFINADAVFDSKVFRGTCFKNDISQKLIPKQLTNNTPLPHNFSFQKSPEYYP